MKEKKLEKPCSVKFLPSTKRALDKLCQKENRTLSAVVEMEVRKGLGLKK